MKFTIQSNILLKQLQHLSGILCSSNALPILDNFLFVLDKTKELKISVSDLETSMEIKIKLEESGDNGSICIPAKILIETLKTFSNQSLTFNIDEKNFGIEICSDNGNYKMTGHSGEEFPKMPALDSPSTFEIESSVLLKIINNTMFAAGSDELRPIMCGILFDMDESGGTFVATDAQKLVKYVSKEAKSSAKSSYVVPKKPLQLIKSISPKGAVVIDYNSANVSFTFDNTVLISRLIDGKYPNYEAVIPKENPNKLIIDRSAFLNSIKRVSVFSNKATSQIRLEMGNGDIKISAEDQDFSSEAKEKIACNYKGEKLEIGFNGKFLNELLGAIENDEIELSLNKPSTAGIIKPYKSEEDVTMLIMPILLNN